MNHSIDAHSRHLGQLFFQRVEELGDRTFIRLQRKGRFDEVSWKDFGAQVRDAVLGLHSLGLSKGEIVAIISENRLEWLAADLAALAAGLPNVIVSPRLSDAAILRILGHSEARAVFVEDETGAGRILNLEGQLASLRHIIVMDKLASVLPHTLAFDQLLRQGARVEKSRLHRILESIHPDDLATIMYTGGSTGEPKGVMRTQKNLLSNIESGSAVKLSHPDELFAIILSLNHLLGRYGFLKSAVTGRATAIVEATEQDVDLKTIRALSPTAMTLVPRVMERIWATILADGDNQGCWQAIEAFDQVRKENPSPDSGRVQRYAALKAALGQAVRDALGGRIKYISYGGAAMPPRIMHFFQVVGLPLLGSYGSTECGGVSLSGIGENRPGSLGKPFANVEVRIADDGEILVGGPTVTPGYFKNPEATSEVLDVDGWFHTGDLGAIDPDGSLRIVGRKKDIFNCSDGTNIYPASIELLLENDPFIRQAILLGDRRPFIAALLVPEGAKMAAELNNESSAFTESELEKVLWSRVKKINERLEDYEKIRKIAVMREDFPERVRSVTTVQKIKIDRKAVEEIYRREIDAIYRSD